MKVTMGRTCSSNGEDKIHDKKFWLGNILANGHLKTPEPELLAYFKTLYQMDG